MYSAGKNRALTFVAISTLVILSVEKRSLGRGAEPVAALVDGLRAPFWVIAGYVLLGIESFSNAHRVEHS
jgi:hypothetical protein